MALFSTKGVRGTPFAGEEAAGAASGVTSIARSGGLRVSVCICTCDRPELLARLLDSLKDIELGDLRPADVDIVVVDNHPTGRARGTCERASHHLLIPLHFDEEPKRGISFARNRAVVTALARGADWIAFIDDDDVPQADWLIHLIARQQETQADIVGGAWQLDAEMPPWAKRIFRNADYGKDGLYGLPRGINTCNVLIGRRILERLGSRGDVFDPAFALSGGEDKDFFIRATKSGAVIELTNRSIIKRSQEGFRLTMRSMLGRGFRAGSTRIRMAQKHETRRQVNIRCAVAVPKLLFSAVALPLTVVSKGLFIDQLYRMGKEFGVLYSRLTGKSSAYYARAAP